MIPILDIFKNLTRERSVNPWAAHLIFLTGVLNLYVISVYMPSKPAKFGNKYQILASGYGYVHRILPCFPKQFALYENLVDLMDKLIDQSLRNCGFMVVVDNFYMTADVIRFFFRIKSQLVGTARSGRFARFFKIEKVRPTQNRPGREKDHTLYDRVMGTGQFKSAWSNANFQRKILVFKVTLREGEFFVYFFFDKIHKVSIERQAKANFFFRKNQSFSVTRRHSISMIEMEQTAQDTWKLRKNRKS